MSHGATTQGVSSKEPFVADISRLPNELNPAAIRSASHYILLAHLVRPLTRLNRVAQLEGELAESWQIQDNFKHFIFVIRGDAKWSDGQPITAEQVVESLRLQLKLNSATHFNFTNIESVKAIDNRRIEVRLKVSNPNFLLQTAHPEFGVVKNSHGAFQFDVTSGPFSLDKHESGKFLFKRNPHYPVQSQTAPEWVQFQSTDVEEKRKGLAKGKIHFAWASHGITPSSLSELVSRYPLQLTRPHIGFTYWISINAHSPKLSSQARRNFIQNALQLPKSDFSELTPFWEPANQLYLPDGLGRPDAKSVAAVWSEIKRDAASQKNLHVKLSLLCFKDFPLKEAIIRQLKVNGIETELTEYKTQEEFEQLAKNGAFDLVQNNNDFSSASLLENLLVTFSISRPLLFMDSKSDAELRQLLKSAENTADSDQKNDSFKRIGVELLRRGLIAPIAYNNVGFLLNKHADLSAWSTLYPEVAFWKLKYRENHPK